MDLEILYQAAAEVLTGQPVKVEFVDWIPGRLGEVFKSKGVFKVRVCTKCNWAGILPVMLHECAHVRLNADLFQDLGQKTPGNNGKGAKDHYSDIENEADENEAEKLAACWLLFADWHAWRFGGSLTEQRLQALIYKDVIAKRARQRG